MKTLLRHLCADNDVQVGPWIIFRYSSKPILGARHFTGLMSPDFKANLSGLKKLLAWVDDRTVSCA